jgi:Fe-S cluster assembly protein SufD
MNQTVLSEILERRKLSPERRQHLETFFAKGFKVQDQDFYKFTNLERFFKELNYFPINRAFDLSEMIDERFPTLYFVDGDLQNPELKIPGIKTSLYTDEVKTLALDGATEIHKALRTDGVRIEISKNTRSEAPIRILNIFTKSGVWAPSYMIECQAFSEATIIEENISLESSYAYFSQGYVKMHPGSKLEHIQIDNGLLDSVHHGSYSVDLLKDSNYRNIILHVGGKLNRRNVEINLKEPGSHGESFNLYLTNANEHSDIHTLINHEAPDSTSQQLAKGILDGESRGVFTGRIHIHPHAQRVASGQLNKNLLLSKKAQMHSQPQLEIFADDVKCSHGSTTGQLSAEEVFYFEARGIPKHKAKTLLAHGFGLEVVMKIQNEIAREKVSAIVLEKLKTKFNLGGSDEHPAT